MMLKNLRQKNGRLVPVAPRKTVKTLGNGYTYLFYHNLPQTGENLLGVRDGNIYMIADSTETLLTSTTGFKSMTQIGNLVNVLDGDGVRVLWWSDDHYILFDVGMDICPVKVDLRVSIPVVTQDDIYNGDYVSSMKGKYKTLITVSNNTYGYSNVNDANSINNQEKRAAAALGLRQKAQSVLQGKGYLSGYCMAIYAIELYDGNYILNSAPVLLGMAADKYNRYVYTHDTLKYDYRYNKAIFLPNYVSWNDGALIYLSPNLDGYYMGVRNVNSIYAKNNSELSDPSYSDATFSPDVSIWEKHVDGNVFNKYMYHVSNLNSLQFKIDNIIDEKYKSLIRSVSIFITKEIDLYSSDKAYLTGSTLFMSSGSESQYFENYNPKPKSNGDILTELKANQQFYKVHEITFDELQSLTPDTWIDIDLKGKLGDNLANQEELPVDNYTHHSLLPNGQMVYNSKLHVFDYKQTLFKPWPTEYNTPQTGVGQFSSDEFTMTDVWEQWIIAEIKTENGISKVVRHQTFQATTKYNSQYNFLSYPDSRARKLTIVTKIPTHGGYTYNPVEFSLTASETHNFAYWISESLKPVTPGILPTLSSDLSWASEQNAELIYRNALKISSVNNPFNFPSDQTHTVGTGVILNAGTNAMRMSDGQFGQYPLYVFTTEGITSLDTGTTVAYNRQSSASLEIPVNTMICPTPFGVLFIGKRGLYVINGQQVQYLSAAIEENMLPNNIVTGWTNWEEWVLGLRLIAYDYQQHEIVLAGAAYNLIYNVDAKQWYISTEQVDGLVENTGSELKMYKRKSKTVITTPAWDEITTPAWDEIITPAWDEYTVTSHPAQRTANIIELNTDGGILSVRFQHAMNVGMIWGNVRLNDVDGQAYEDYQLQIRFSEEDCTQWITLGNININPDMNNVDMEFGHDGTDFYDGYKVGDDGNPNENGNYWKDTHYYIYWPQKNYPSNPVVNINIWDSVFVVHHYATIVHHDAVIVHHPAITSQVYLSDIKDFSQMEQTETSVELVTRPMTYESDECKNLLRMMLRGRMYNMTSIGQFVQVYGSNDGVNHTLLRAFTMPEARQGRDHKDLDFGAFARATYRNYVLRLVATIDEGSSIGYVESEVTDRWVNDKDR